MRVGTFLLETAQSSAARWRDACELAAWCYLNSFHIPKPKSKLLRGDGAGQDVLEMLACDRKSQSGAVRMHSCSLQHLAWLGLQWNSVSVLFPLRRSLQQLFHSPHETSRLETDAPESICLLVPEARLGSQAEASCTAWIEYRASPGETRPSPVLIIHWARSLQATGVSLNSCDQKESIGRSVCYWKEIVLSLKTIKKHRSIPEPADPLFKHFHSVDIQVQQVAACEEEARVAFAMLGAAEGKTDDALLAFEAVNNAVSYWNLCTLCQRKAEEVESDGVLPEEQEERKACLVERQHCLMKIIEESSSDPSVAAQLPVSVRAVTEMLNAVIREPGENGEEGSLASRNISRAAHVEVKDAVPSPKKFSFSPTNTYQTLLQWAEDHKSLLQKLCQQVEALKLLPLARLFAVASHLL